MSSSSSSHMYASAIVFNEEGKVLLVQRSDTRAWTPVTGIVDPGEHPALTAVREVEEEAGVVAAVRRLAAVNVGRPIVHPNGDQAQYLDHTFLCRYDDGEPFPADDESVEARWCRLDDLPPMEEHLRRRIGEAADHPPGAPPRLGTVEG